MTFLWLLLLAHGIADFILQTDFISAAKSINRWQGYIYHGLGIFICTLLAVHFFGWWTAFIAACLVTLTHLLLDWIKSITCSMRTRLVKGGRLTVVGFVVDQMLHIVILVWIWHLLDSPVDKAVAGFYNTIFFPLYLDITVTRLEVVVMVAAVFIFVSFGGSVFIRKVLDQLYPAGPGIRGETPAGKYIGILERMLILTLTAGGALSGIGFVFAAKSIARFNAISENRQFAEYYLIGTLLSFFLALLGGLLLKNLL